MFTKEIFFHIILYYLLLPFQNGEALNRSALDAIRLQLHPMEVLKRQNRPNRLFCRRLLITKNKIQSIKLLFFFSYRNVPSFFFLPRHPALTFSNSISRRAEIASFAPWAAN